MTGGSALDVRRLAARLYRDAPWLVRFLQRNRDRICPIGVLIEQVPPGSTVLDVGCGAGLFLLNLAAAGRAAAGTGVDTSASAVTAAQRAAEHLPELAAGPVPAVTFGRVAPGDDWPDGPFDVVSLIDVMHHVAPDRRRAFFARAAARLRPGGRLLYKDMCAAPAWRAWANRLHDLLLARQWIRYTPLAEVEAWAAAEGLEVLCRRTYTRLVYGHELLVLRRRDAEKPLASPAAAADESG